MKRTLLLLTALLIVAPDFASAQDAQNARGDRRAPQANTRPAPARGPQRPDRPGAGRPTTRPTQPHVRPVPGRPGGSGGPQVQPPRPVRPTPPRPPKPSRPRPPQHRPGAGRPPNFRPISGRPFRYPHGYRYRRWSIGLILPHLFLAPSYYYDDYAPLGVGAPPPGYRWVRYGPDLLMVQLGTGRIADVIYGAFY